MPAFVRSFFGHIASSIESITSEGSVKLHASGILREDYHNCKQVRQQGCEDACSVLRARLLSVSNPGALRPHVLYQRVHVCFEQA